MDTARIKHLAGITEALDVSLYDSLSTLVKYMKELQTELADAKREGNEEFVNEIEQDIFDLGELIKRKKNRS